MAGSAAGELTNWAGNHRYRARALHEPRTLDELRRVASTCASLQVLNTRHTFTDMGDADELVTLGQLAGADEIVIDSSMMTVSVGASVTYATLADALQARGLALANMASLPHISVSGGIATATHGSGDRLGNLATSVRALQLVTSEGEVIEIGASDPRLPGAAVHLGALGIITRVTLAVEPSYNLRQTVYEGMEWEALEANLDAITTAGLSVSVFHTFGERVGAVWVKSRVGGETPPQELFGALAATEPRNPVPGADPSNCTAQLGVAGPWHQRLPHFQAGFTPSAGEEIQSEWFVARRDWMPALAALRELGPAIEPKLYVSEMRTVAADELWLSPHHQRDSVGLHFTWHRDPAAVAELAAEVERALAPFAPRPHWGKFFLLDATTLTGEYPRLDDFLSLRDQLDPRRTFVNAWFEEKLLSQA